ncbi:hypothetical protein GJ744_009829 [Endocarpon pusillum]|uniref:Uncharacterized protein n=1 Tax=Endocarpon pusillum TaxID=364733 RepID=A0A8H7AQI9_9EURO|nr:hypothetical protein GJ744_009829 [Endocarpon pusillum]
MGTETALPPMKDLASSDPTLRRSTLQILLTHLSTLPPSTRLTTLQTLQIWTSLFYTLYMHDSRSTAPLSTQNLINTLTTTLLTSTIPPDNPHLKLALTTGFWETISREWSGIDRHRMDKYLLLVRCMLRAVFLLLYESTRGQATTEEKEAANGQVEVLRKWPLSTGRGNGEGRKVPDGIRYHVLDVWVDELEKVFQDGDREDEGKEREKERRTVVLGMIMGLVEKVAGDALTKGVRLRSKDVLADGRLEEWR